MMDFCSKIKFFSFFNSSGADWVLMLKGANFEMLFGGSPNAFLVRCYIMDIYLTLAHVLNHQYYNSI
jgi:hypothetical protein